MKASIAILYTLYDIFLSLFEKEDLQLEKVISEYLSTEDLDNLLKKHEQLLKEYGAARIHGYFQKSRVILNPQAIANALFYPDILPETLRLQLQNIYLQSVELENLYFFLAAVCGLQNSKAQSDKVSFYQFLYTSRFIKLVSDSGIFRPHLITILNRATNTLLTFDNEFTHIESYKEIILNALTRDELEKVWHNLELCLLHSFPECIANKEEMITKVGLSKYEDLLKIKAAKEKKAKGEYDPEVISLAHAKLAYIPNLTDWDFTKKGFDLRIFRGRLLL